MLDRKKLIQAFSQVVPKHFISKQEQLILAQDLFYRVLNTENFFDQNRKYPKSKYTIPNFLEPIGIYKTEQAAELEYNAIGIDGSQIYPDKHEGFNYGLINIATVNIEYKQKSRVKFYTVPTVITEAVVGDSLSPDLINCQRTQFEFEAGLNFNELSNPQIYSNKKLILFDGSLIFWHLESKEDNIKQYFLEKYLETFKNFYTQKAVYCSYISLPQSKDIINILRLAQEENKFGENIELDLIVDVEIIGSFLGYGCRSSIFMIDSSISKFYPTEDCPCFIYLNVGSEIIRVEFPYWIAKNIDTVEMICSLVLDQCNKGLGYPVVLSLAHEQAVIKATDRDFFYLTLNKLHRTSFSGAYGAYKNNQLSVKLAKKRKSII